jgi:ATP-dependent Lhr-like helicase
VPTQDTLVLERFFDESGGMQLVLHSPHGSRINRAWGLSLRKRFCRKFNFELQAAATEDALVLSLGVTHSFPLPEVFTYLSPGSVEHVLTQALLDAPMFTVRWRWNANRSLAVPRFRGGKKVPAPLQRMQAEDLLSVVFPDQLACAENLAGEREVPDHPLAKQTIRDCLTEAMDLYGFVRVLEAVSAGEKTLVARDLTEPSPIAQEILNAKPYAFLDDAPLEERRTQAVMSRRWLDPESAGDLGALDADAIARVRKEIRPDPRDIDELADALVMSGYLTAAEGRDIDAAWFAELGGQSRAALVRTDLRGPALWVAAERLPGVLTVFPEAVVEPELRLPENLRSEEITRETALVELVRSRLEILGPAEAGGLAAELGLETGAIDGALLTLESEGFAFRGRFTPATEAEEWCDRRLLARIHRYTLTRLRREIEPVSAADFLRFVMEWQGVAGERPEGPEATARAVELLEGFPAAATSWEADLLPSRVADYDPSWLDALCLSGRTVWARLVAPESLENGRSASPVRSTPVALVARSRLACWMAGKETAKRVLSANAATVFDVLRQRGASFFDELAASADLLPGYLEEALAELVAVGLVASDSFTGLRALLVPAARRSRHRRHGGRRFEIREAGRWSVLPRKPERDPEHVAMVYLRRYGVVFRKLLEREAGLVSWRELLRVYRRLEARGEIRGGRFVGGFTGEQFALPGAVETLRKTRRREKDGALVSVSGADPLNLVGIVTPGAKVPALASNRVLYRDGEPVAVKVGGEDRLLVPADGENAWVLQQSLVRRATPPGLRLYLGS